MIKSSYGNNNKIIDSFCNVSPVRNFFIVPVTILGRYVAIVYMGFGISMITILLSTITSNFYKKRIESVERKKDKEELDFFRKTVMDKLSELEKKQNQCLDLFHQLYIKDNDKPKKSDNKNL